MPDFEVRRNSTAKLDMVDGRLKVGKNARVEAIDGKTVKITKGAYFEGGAEVNCDLECDSLKIDHAGIVKINGNLTVHNSLDIIQSIEVSGETRAGDVDVEGRIRSKSIFAKKIRANGVVEVKENLEAEESLEVTGKLKALGQVKLHDLGISGQAMVGGGLISGNIEVRGKFESISSIDFGELHVLGNATLPSGCKGKKISAFGKLSVIGDITCNQIEVQGGTDVEGNCDSAKIKVNGKLQVSGSLTVSELLETFGTTEVGNKFMGGSMRVGGKLLVGQVILSGDADIAGRVEAKLGLKARTLTIRSGSTCEGVIVAETVELGKSYLNIVSWQTDWAGQNVSARLIGRQSKVQDVYATNVHLRAASSAGRIFAQNVELERGCSVDQVVYTGELKMPDGPKCAHINHPPEKVEKLPTPPI